MPTHVYLPLRDRPTWWDRLLVHPMDSTAAVIVCYMGFLSGLSVVYPGFTPSQAMDAMPVSLRIMSALFMVAGGLLALTGLYWFGDVVSRGWAIERFGWLLAAGALVTYGGCVLTEFPESSFAWGVPLFLAGGSLLRFISILKIERNTRQVLAQVKGG